MDAQLVELADEFRGHIGRTRDDESQLSAQEGFSIHLDQTQQNLADARDGNKAGRTNDGEFRDRLFGVACREPGTTFHQDRQGAADEAEHMAQGQNTGITVMTKLATRSVDAIQGTTHQGAMRQHGTLRRTCSATREEDGGRVVLVNRSHRSGMVGAIGDGDSLAWHAVNGLGEVLAVSQHLYAKLHAATHDGLRRKLRRQVDGHITS